LPNNAEEEVEEDEEDEDGTLVGVGLEVVALANSSSIAPKSSSSSCSPVDGLVDKGFLAVELDGAEVESVLLVFESDGKGEGRQ
jgi:hypothetical protein